MRITRFLPAIGLAGLVILTGVPSQGQAPKSGGWLTLRLREDLPQGFAIHESAPISAAHASAASYRTGCVGTGPFKVKDWRKGEFVEYVKNPDYFVKGRPYLDGLRYLIIGERGTATAALQAGRVDTAFPGQTPKPIAERLKKAVPQLVMTPVNTSVIDHLVVNTKKPPFDNAEVRLALSRAIDRRARIDAVYQGGAVLGASMASPPYGVWGLLDKDIRALPGNGKAADE